MGEPPWHDADTLRKEYAEKTREELAEKWDCSQGTIQYWLKKHEIERRDRGGGDKNADYRDGEILRELYHEKGMSFPEVADELDTSICTIQRWMEKNGVETRPAPQDSPHAYHGFHSKGSEKVGGEYEVVSTSIDGVNHEAPIHRLIAVAHGKLDPSEFWNQDIDVHHKTKHGLDNRPENLEVMSHSDHTKHHRPWEWIGKE